MEPFRDCFEDKVLRRGFVRKVFSLLSVQLLFTFSSCLMTNSFDGPKLFLQSDSGQALFVVSILGLFGMIIMMMCNYTIVKHYPSNYIYLVAFTLCTSYQLSVVTSTYATQIVWMALAITASVTSCLTMYACQTRYDFTDAGGYLVAALVALLMFGLINLFLQNQFMQSIYAALSALLFSCFIVYDTQLIVGGKHNKYRYSIDDYVLAAISIYMDVVNLFVSILDILNRE